MYLTLLMFHRVAVTDTGSGFGESLLGILSSFLVGMGRRFLSNPLTCHVQMKENNTLKQMCARTAVTLCENAVHVCTWQKVDSSSGGKTTKGHK